MVVYRYFMCGRFRPEKFPKRMQGHNSYMLGIDIPSPILYEEEEGVLNDENLSFYFERPGPDVLISVYIRELGKKLSLLGYYNYDYFREQGGHVYQIPDFSIVQFDSSRDPEELAEAILSLKEANINNEEWKMSKHEIDTPFTKLFPTLEKGKSISMDSQGYRVTKMEIFPP